MFTELRWLWLRTYKIQDARGENQSLQFKLNARHVELCLRDVEVVPDVRPEVLA